MLRVLHRGQKLILVQREFHLVHLLRNNEKVPKRKVKETVELVQLLDSNDKILGLKPKIEAEKLARKLKFSLQRVQDTKFGITYPVYKFVSSSSIFERSEKNGSQSFKKLPISSRISDHDLDVKVKRLKAWLEKKNSVHVVISGTVGGNGLEKVVFEKIKEKLSGLSRFLDVRYKDDSVTFTAMPPIATPVP